MQPRLVSCADCLLALLVLAGPAHANDSVMGGSGANLMPMKTSDVSMASEDITITFAPGGHWLIDAQYVFRNASKAPIVLQLGFPEHRCNPADDGDCVDPKAYHFNEMRTLVRDQVVKQRKGKVSRKHEWGEVLGATWLFDVRFEPLETVAVRHTYRVPGNYAVDGTQDITYVTRTGALWAGPIGLARFHVRVPARANAYEATETLPQAAVSFIRQGDQLYAELSYQLRNWTPDRDLSFSFREGLNAWRMERNEEDSDIAPTGPQRSGLSEDERCENFIKLWELGERLTYPQDRPTAREIQVALATGINTRRICKNAVFALYGRRFDDEPLNRYFYGPRGFAPGAWPYGVQQPNPNFDTAWLRKADWKALELMERLPEAAGVERR